MYSDDKADGCVYYWKLRCWTQSSSQWPLSMTESGELTCAFLLHKHVLIAWRMLLLQYNTCKSY